MFEDVTVKLSHFKAHKEHFILKQCWLNLELLARFCILKDLEMGNIPGESEFRRLCIKMALSHEQSQIG